MEIVVSIDRVDGAYTFGVREESPSFGLLPATPRELLHSQELTISGQVYEGDVVAKRVFISINVASGEEPDAYDQEKGKDTFGIGEIDIIGETLNVHAVIPRSGMLYVLQLLSNRLTDAKVYLDCSPFGAEGANETKSYLHRIAISAT